MWKFVALFGLFGAPVFAADYSCGEWSIPAYQEGGAVTVTVTENILTWSNGTIARTARILASEALESIYHQDGQTYIVPFLSFGSETRPSPDSLNVRRVNSIGANPVADLRCELIK
jgi:hypothetical protein